MSELRKGGGGGFPSEASRMLEAALEQMDGIIQGAKYELPHQFDNIAIQVRSPADQCCGSGMFILDPLSEFFHPRSRVKKIPDPHQKNSSFFNPKNFF
jgi:hypothetical protein